MTITPVFSQTSHGLSDKEKARAVEIEKDAMQAGAARRSGVRPNGAISRLANTKAGKEGRNVVTSIVPVGSASTLKRARATSAKPFPERRAIVTRYDYATAITSRTTVDLGSGKVLAVRENVNYPTPLAPEELNEAKQLLRSAEPEIDGIIRNADPDVLEILHLNPLASSPADPRFGHRMVWLWVAKPVHTAKYLVDLSTKEVSKIGSSSK